MDDLGLEVDALDVEASVDATGTLWLVRAPVCTVCFVNRAPARTDAEADAAEQKARDGADAAGAELKRLLALANKRGVDAAASFRHFDARGLGRVDKAGLVRGLAALGTPISPEAAELLQRDLAGNAARRPRLDGRAAPLRRAIFGADPRRRRGRG